MHESKGQHIGKAPSLHLFTFLMFFKSCISDVRVFRSMPVFVYRGHIYTLLQHIFIKLSTEVS